MTPWTVAHQAPLSMGFPRQEYWSGLHFLLQGIFPTRGSNPHLLHWQVGALLLSHQGSPALHNTMRVNKRSQWNVISPRWHLEQGPAEAPWAWGQWGKFWIWIAGAWGVINIALCVLRKIHALYWIEVRVFPAEWLLRRRHWERPEI